MEAKLNIAIGIVGIFMGIYFLIFGKGIILNIVNILIGLFNIGLFIHVNIKKKND